MANTEKTKPVAADRVKPITITDTETGEVYVLEFSRDSVRFAENRRFNVNELTTFPHTNIPALFFYAFRKNHPRITRDKTDKVLEAIGGLSPDALERLVMLYNEPAEALIALEGDQPKNSTLVMEL